MSETFYLLYPERRVVSAAKIVGWYQDAVADGTIAEEYLDVSSPHAMAEALQDAGIITLGREPDYETAIAEREDRIADRRYDETVDREMGY